MVSRLEISNGLANLLDNARGLVAEHRWCGMPIETLDEMKIAVAHTGRDGFDQNFAIAWLVDIDLFDRERLIRAVEDCGFHRIYSII